MNTAATLVSGGEPVPASPTVPVRNRVLQADPFVLVSLAPWVVEVLLVLVLSRPDLIAAGEPVEFADPRPGCDVLILQLVGLCVRQIYHED